MSVGTAQRFSPSSPCPICGGTASAPSGKGERCYGFLSSDGRWAHCTREEHAGALEQKEGSGTYPHRLKGECGCVLGHGDLVPTPGVRRNECKKPLGEPAAVWSIKDERGEVQAIHVRFDHDGGKECKWRLPEGTFKEGLKGRKLSTLPLYRSEHVADCPEDLPVVVVEGEKAADALAEVYPAVLGTVTGASGTPGAEALEVLRSRRVVLWPDNDEEGRRHMARIAEALCKG